MGQSLILSKNHQPFFPALSLEEIKDFVQLLLALRIFLPFFSINISTRENASFRKQLIHLGVNKMSAGVSTKVGGHTQEEKDTGQFDISDERSVDEMAADLKRMGYQPVYKDWQYLN